MHLIIDIGNSFNKIAVFDNNNIVHNDTCDIFDTDQIELLFKLFPKINRAIISSVSKEIETLKTMISGYCETVNFTHTTKIPITNNYETPQTLGLDRLAAVVGAYSLAPGTDSFVIDAGTAITFDYIDKEGIYHGGTISPGMQIRFKALNNFTKKLPLCSCNENVPFLGRNTHDAIVAGVQNGIRMEIEGYISLMEQDLGRLNVFLTGGDAFFFDKKLKKTIFAEPFLVMKGLNRILHYNA